MPEGAIEMIRENVEWMTPVAMVTKVKAAFLTVTADQVHKHWMKLSQPHWRRDNLQLPSASLLLEEYGNDVDVFKPENLPDGVEILCWGMKKIAAPKIVEVGFG